MTVGVKAPKNESNQKYIKRSQTGSKKAARLILRAEKKLSRTLDDEALRDLAREERRVKTRSKEGLSAAQAEDFKLKKRITEAAREQFTDAEWVKLDNAALIFRPLRARTKTICFA